MMCGRVYVYMYMHTYMCSFTPQVVVSVGRSLSYTPGSITFVTVSLFPVAAVVGGVAGGGVSLILLIVAIVLVACRRESVMRSQVDVLMMQTKTLAEEHKRGNDVPDVCVCVYAYCVCMCVCT